MIHELKINQEYLDNLILGKKRCEIRLNDRDYQLGDILEFWDHSGERATKYQFLITHMHSGLGLEKNYVVLSVSEIEDELVKNK